ncbi:fimbrial protein [Edwardsiella anguillarum]|uniref:fimbrial protein n=1 Tax=Edwardsiella anguillarum TaxID=1821960 RepID=UPI0008FFAA42|nr:hypothetical protein CGL57_13300 [Edwardsiella anguillarum]
MDVLNVFTDFFAAISSSQADITGDKVSITFTGTLLRKPCHINNDEPINIHFGNVGVNKVDGVNYIQTIPYTVTCDDQYNEDENRGQPMLMFVNGSVTGYDPAALNTSVAGLGIHIIQDGHPMEINKGLRYEQVHNPVLQAVPVKQPGVILSGGAFSATATLLVVFE